MSHHPDQPLVLSQEHKRTGLLTADQVPGPTMPDGYKQSGTSCWARHAHSANIIGQ